MSYADKVAAYLEMVEDRLREIKESPRNRRLDDIHDLCTEVLEYKDRALALMLYVMQPTNIHHKRAVESALTLEMRPRDTYKSKATMVDDMGMKYIVKTDCFILITK